MKTKDGYRKLVKRLDVPGQAHYLTFSCFHNQAFLSKDRTRQWLINALAKAREKHRFELWGWVIMPTHVHLMLLPNRDTSISKILGSIKIPVARLASNWVKDNATEFLSCMTDIQLNGKKTIRFWQKGGGYDRNICSVKELYEKINYMHKNPIRGGLVSRPEGWYWSSFRGYEFNDSDPISIDRDSLPPMEHT